jgi:hypothetical protein
MYYEGLSRLVAAGVTLPRLHAGDPARQALEGYPGLLAHELIGSRSYKNSDAADRLIARKDIVERLEQGRTRLGLRVQMGHAQREALVDDASGDRLDALLCLVQAAWASAQPGLGLPARWTRSRAGSPPRRRHRRAADSALPADAGTLRA